MKIYQYIKPCVWLAMICLSQQVVAQKRLSLQQAKELALSRNNNLKVSDQNIEAAKAGKAQADAGGKPTVDGSVTGFYLGKPLNKLLPEYGISPSVSVSQAIYTGGKVKLGKEAASISVQINEEQKVLTTSEVLLNTVRAYWQLVSVKEKIKLAQQTEKQLANLYEYLNNSYTAGLIYKNDLLRVKVQQNENELNLTRAKDGYLLAKLNLAQITGLEDTTDFILADSVIINLASAQIGESLDSVSENRSEMKILQKSMEAERIQEKLLLADFKPTVGFSASVFAGLGANGMNPTVEGGNSMTSYVGLVQLSIPIYDWGQRRAKVRQQQFKITGKQYQMRETKELISLEVKQAQLQLNQSAKRVELSGASLEQAGENLRLALDRLKAGTIVGKDVLEAQTIWQVAYTGTIDAKVEYKVNEAVFKKAIGGLE